MNLIEHLQGKLIVSCQAEEGFPLNTPDHLAALAATAVIGGASAIRASEPENIRAIKQVVDVPIIGIYKYDYAGFEVRITPTIKEVAAIVEAGVDIIAVDATDRPRPDGKSLADFFAEIRAQFDVPIMADISTLTEGVTAAQLGVDIVATTMSGYTGYSPQQPSPDIQLIRDLAAIIDKPIIAEGRISTPDDVRAALDAGAHAVVVGSAITRPHLITERFLAATAPKPPVPTVFALDIGGTKIAGGIVDGAGQILVADQVSTPAQAGGMAVIEAAGALLESLRAEHDGNPPAAIGISTGGQVDANGDIIGATATIAEWQGAPLQETLARQFELPVAVLNDGHAAALAEATYGAGRGHDAVLCIVIGTGLGGGLVVNGQVQHGAHGLSGSLGQLQITINGQSHQPLESLVSGPALLRNYNARVEHAAATGAEVAQRLRAGDEFARIAVSEMGQWLGQGLSHALHVCDPSIVVVGGSVVQVGDVLLESAGLALSKFGYSSVVHTPIVAAELGTRAGLIGAGAVGQRTI